MDRRAVRRRFMIDRPIVAIMVKAPLYGRVKTRLAREIGTILATMLYRHLTASLVRGLKSDPRWRTILAVTPGGSHPEHFPIWGNVPRVKQGSGDVGRRMQRLFERLGKGPMIIIGSDIPFVTPALLADAFRRLAGNDAVFGPAEDGGYWLVGLRRRPRMLRPFAGVRWSSQHALADTLANLKGLRVGFAAKLYDIDRAEDYRRFRQSSR